MNRALHEIPLADAMPTALGQADKRCVITMATGQWDGLLAAAYDSGWILLELDANDVPVRAYQNPAPRPAARRSTTQTPRTKL
jgi:hypothetical protein